MPGYGHRYWSEATPLNRRPTYPVLRGEHTADVVVIGGGLTGVVAAQVLAAGGMDVVLLEADRLASGATAAGLGIISPDPAPSYRAIEADAGRRTAKRAWAETRRAALDFASAIRRVSKRNLEPAPLIVNARTTELAALLRKEQAARKAAGFDAPWLTAAAACSEIGTATAGALRLREASVHDPVKTTLAFARAATDRGARIFERSPVRRTRFDRRSAEVHLATGRIHTRGVVVATGAPGGLFAPLKRHVRVDDAYVVVTEPLSAAMRKEVGRRQTVLAEAGPDPHWLRWLRDDRAIFAGALGRPVPARQRDKALVQRTGQLMYELSVRYPVISGLPARWSWSVPIVTTPAGLPLIGPHRNYPFHFFALASGWNGDAFAWRAARAALEHFRDA